MKIFSALILTSLVLLNTSFAAPCIGVGKRTNRLSQNRVTFQFDRSYRCGRFVNGDYWVLGPVKLVKTRPVFTGEHHGFEINPTSSVRQGYDNQSSLASSFNPKRVPRLPVTVKPGSSIVKVFSIVPITGQTAIKSAAVLTVVKTVPPADAFRPGYAGRRKKIYRYSKLRTKLLPSLAAPAVSPTLVVMAKRFSKPWLDILSNWTGRLIHPADNMPDYGAGIAIQTNEAALRLMLNSPLSARRAALIGLVQYGIDLRSIVEVGGTFPANGGHSLGRVLPLAFAAVLINDRAFSAGLPEKLLSMHESESVVVGVGGRALWGQPGNELSYWRNQLADVGSRTVKDPYGYIDGGKEPGGSYQFCCNSQGFKGLALASELMPELKRFYNDQTFFDYVNRWMTHGAWTQPDPCAPVDPRDLAQCAAMTNKYECPLTNYGITYGPDGEAGCILDTDPSDGIGRFPALHGANRAGGYWGSAFVSAMWDMHHR